MTASREAPAAPPRDLPWGGHAKGSRGYRRLLAALACAGVATFAQLYSTQALLPRLSSDLGVDAAQAALTVSFATLGLAGSVLPWSFVADRVGRVPAMTAGVMAATLLGLIAPFAPGIGLLVALRCLEGVALGAVPALAVAYLTEEISTAHTALAAGTYVAGTTVGGLLGRLVAGPISDVWGWRAAIFAVAALGAVAAGAFIALAPRQRGFVPANRRAQSAASQAAASQPAASQSAVARLAASQASASQPAVAGRLAALFNRRLGALYFQAFALMGGFVAIYNFLGFRLELPPFALPTAFTSLLFLAYLSGTFSSGYAARLSGRFGRRAVIIASIALMAAGVLLTIPDWLPSILAGLLLLTAGFFGAHGLGSGWIGTLATAGRAQAAALYNLAYYAGSSLVGWLGGLVFQSFGWSWLAVGTGAVALGTAAVAAVAHPAALASQRRGLVTAPEGAARDR
ncbi:MFS transporter [Sinomonas sp. ASV322]|uniref:MFS transporter n=1 Tax=Sinomonas sp. ASV322 TaxID=3041920 RepID=UPI0027DDD5EF|nr:MFS transporter [Sinomonas sp. ASV322]MDQ4501965.1 MFS transporter [Sinomonas sp. ASV322]